MKKIEQNILEVHRRIPVIRTVEDRNDTNTESISVLVQKQVGTSRKTLNIPIGDVNVDPDYNKNVSPTFQLPSIYVKHIKKIGDEADVSLDYIISAEDEVWIKGLPSQGVPKDVAKLLTHEAFEIIFNIFERYTGLSKEPIPQINAGKVVAEDLQWTDTAINKILPLVYAYWLSKRGRLNKPLCRKYWPQVTSSDTNPRQVFRTRDKERYRLRKQQKRNDIDAFRKMQQLRREFATARDLLQLVLERELLREAEFDVQREIFEQRMYDLEIPSIVRPCSPSSSSAQSRTSAEGGSSSDNLTSLVPQLPPVVSTTGTPVAGAARSGDEKAPRRAVPYRHVLKFEDLLYPQEIAKADANKKLAGAAGNKQNKGASAKAAAAAEAEAADAVAAVAAAADALAAAALKKAGDKKRKRDSLQAAEPAMVVYTYDAAGNIIHSNNAAAPSAAAGPKASTATGSGQGRGGGRGGQQRSLVANNFNAPGNSVDGLALLQGESSAIVESLGAVVDLRAVHPSVEGPTTVCQPAWPTFIDPMPLRDKAHQTRTVAEYMEDLELRTDAAGKVIVPVSYRARCRIARGGRLVMDRIPVYNDQDDGAVADNEAEVRTRGDCSYIYPTSLPYQYPAQAFNLHLASQTPAPAPGTGAPLPVSGAMEICSAGMKVEGGGAVTPLTAAAELPELPLCNTRYVLQSLRNRTHVNATAAQNSGTQASVGLTPAQLSYSAGMTLQQRARLQRMPKMPSFAPPVKAAVNSTKAARLAAILCASDSEDERVHIPKYRRGEDIERNIGTKAQPVEQAKIKYVTKLR